MRLVAARGKDGKAVQEQVNVPERVRDGWKREVREDEEEERLAASASAASGAVEDTVVGEAGQRCRVTGTAEAAYSWYI